MDSEFLKTVFVILFGCAGVLFLYLHNRKEKQALHDIVIHQQKYIQELKQPEWEYVAEYLKRSVSVELKRLSTIAASSEYGSVNSALNNHPIQFLPLTRNYIEQTPKYKTHGMLPIYSVADGIVFIKIGKNESDDLYLTEDLAEIEAIDFSLLELVQEHVPYSGKSDSN